MKKDPSIMYPISIIETKGIIQGFVEFPLVFPVYPPNINFYLIKRTYHTRKFNLTTPNVY